MTIKGFDREAFKGVMREYFTPSRAISNPQHLRGREIKLRQIDRAFNSPGKHVFIFGDRGVGKTSLAQSAAVLHQSSDGTPLLVACGNHTKTFELTRDIAKLCLPSFQVKKEKRSTILKIGIPGSGIESQSGTENGDLPEIKTMNEAIHILKFVRQHHSREPVIIVDEFDQIQDDNEKKLFADLLKQISDQDVGIRIIICGIGTSLDDLIGAHLSTGRYLSPVELERLSYDALWEIIWDASKVLGVEVDRETVLRIGLVSDGFPYYVHLIGEMLFWAIFEDDLEQDVCQLAHYAKGVADAVLEAQSTLKLTYEKATQKYSDDYQEVLWAVADTVMLRRQVTEIFEKSYIPIMKYRKNRKVLDKKTFNSRLANLKSERHGFILDGKGAGWYQFRENIVRGYVRLRAEQENVPLGIDHHLA